MTEHDINADVENSRAKDAARAARMELLKAMAKFKPFASAQEGYAILLEEVEELREAVRANDLRHAREEAVQVAAMALRFLVDIDTDDKVTNQR